MMAAMAYQVREVNEAQLFVKRRAAEAYKIYPTFDI